MHAATRVARLARQSRLALAGLALLGTACHRVARLARQSRLALAGLALLGTACHHGVTDPGALVDVTSTPDGIVLVNHSAAPAHYLAFEPGWLALANMVPCSDGLTDPCPRLAPGATLVIAWTAVFGYSPTLHSYRVSWGLVGRTPIASGIVELTH